VRGSSRSARARRGDDETVPTCPICNHAFDERAFQFVVAGLGAFDSLDCLEEARRRKRRREREELVDHLLEAVENRGDVSTPSAETTPPGASS
jgi:hypothetical protein